MAQYRSEWKYLCSDGQLEVLTSRLSAVLSPDRYAESGGTYRVRSLYFDDFKNSCASGNESGNGVRYKYRIRYYGKDLSGLHLERKEKRYGLGNKVTCPLTLDEYRDLVNGNGAELFWKTDKPLLRELCVQNMTRLYAPKAIIDYERRAFVEPVTHIRITMDRNISAAYECQAFLDRRYMCFPLQQEHQNILEVKFDSIFPGWLRNMIESVRLQQTSFSKYYLGRKKLDQVLR